MNTEHVNIFPWSKDLKASRDLTRSEKSGFAIILYTHVATNLSACGVASPLDRIAFAAPSPVHSLTLMPTAAA